MSLWNMFNFYSDYKSSSFPKILMIMKGWFMDPIKSSLGAYQICKERVDRKKNKLRQWHCDKRLDKLINFSQVFE